MGQELIPVGEDKNPVGVGKILLRDKNFYLVVEFTRLAKTDFKVFEKGTKLVLHNPQRTLLLRLVAAEAAALPASLPAKRYKIPTYRGPQYPAPLG